MCNGIGNQDLENNTVKENAMVDIGKKKLLNNFRYAAAKRTYSKADNFSIWDKNINDFIQPILNATQKQPTIMLYARLHI